MYACFLVQAYLEKHCGELAMQVLQSAVLPVIPNSLVLATQVRCGGGGGGGGGGVIDCT